jgi:DNA repair protein RadC
MPLIKELPVDERPREKLLKHGGKSLSNMELLALLIGSGTTGDSVLALASRVLAAMENGIGSLRGMSPEELTDIRGIGTATAARLLAAAELGVRIASMGPLSEPKIGCPDDVARMYRVELAHEKQECLIAVLMNIRGEAMCGELISRGGIRSADADPSDVFRPAVKRGAASVILVHNHPSGDPEPSETDILLTKRLVQVGELIGIRVIDHIIIGKGRHVSLKSRELL